MVVVQDIAGDARRIRRREDAIRRSPVIGLDCDGVLASDRLLWEQMAKRFPKHIPSRYEDLRTFEWPRATEQTAALCAELSADPLFTLRLAPIPGMRDALQTLAAQGYELHVITARPACVRDATRLWLRLQGVGQYVRGIHCVEGGPAKVPLALKLGCSAFVEDNFATAQALGAAGIRSYLLDAPYNRLGHDATVRVENWQTLLDDVLRAIPARPSLDRAG